jgi:hypothetical protein
MDRASGSPYATPGCDAYGQPARIRYSESAGWDNQLRVQLPAARAIWPASRIARDLLTCSRADEGLELAYLDGLKNRRADSLARINLEDSADLHGQLLLQVGIDLGQQVPPALKPVEDLAVDASYQAGAAALVFKELFDRPRPVQVRPSIAPLFCPGHPSFPSGHATKAMAVALGLAEALSRSRLDEGTRRDLQSKLCDTAMAIARRREIAGVHFPSDSLAGYVLARKVIEVRLADPDFAAMVDRASRAF